MKLTFNFGNDFFFRWSQIGFSPGTRRLPSDEDVTTDPWTGRPRLSLINQSSYFRIFVSFSFDLVFQQFLASFSFLINKIAWAVGESQSEIGWNWWKWKRIQTMEITLIRGLSGSGTGIQGPKLDGPDQKNSRNSGPDQDRKIERFVDPWLGKSTLADDIEKKLKVCKITILSMSHTWVWWVIDMSHSEKTGQSSKDKRRFLFYRSEWKL